MQWVDFPAKCFLASNSILFLRSPAPDTKNVPCTTSEWHVSSVCESWRRELCVARLSSALTAFHFLSYARQSSSPAWTRSWRSSPCAWGTGWRTCWWPCTSATRTTTCWPRSRNWGWVVAAATAQFAVCISGETCKMYLKSPKELGKIFEFGFKVVKTAAGFSRLSGCLGPLHLLCLPFRLENIVNRSTN